MIETAIGVFLGGLLLLLFSGILFSVACKLHERNYITGYEDARKKFDSEER